MRRCQRGCHASCTTRLSGSSLRYSRLAPTDQWISFLQAGEAEQRQLQRLRIAAVRLLERGREPRVGLDRPAFMGHQAGQGEAERDRGSLAREFSLQVIERPQDSPILV